MVEEMMPATEAEIDAGDDERASYELAFHILPTVVEGEVHNVFAAIKEIVTSAGGEIVSEEAPERFDLAYEIVKHLEGKNRRFGSAYFGWIRFKAETAAAPTIAHAVETHREILRHLLIRLTRIEDANPFRFHEALAAVRQVTEVTEREVKPEQTEERAGEVNETELEEALKKDEA
jgi:ribosomal protein S6